MRQRFMACLVAWCWLLASIVSDVRGESPVPPAPPLKTGQTGCWNSLGKPVDCAGTGQDGELQAGISAVPRFTDNGNGSVTDNATGLIWLKDAGCLGDRKWDSAVETVAQLAAGKCGLVDGSVPGDWRIPNYRELQSLVDYGTEWLAIAEDYPFQNINPVRTYMSSTHTKTYVAGILFHKGDSSGCAKGDLLDVTCSVWPIRHRTADTVSGARIPKTGATKCWNSSEKRVDCVGTGQDGELQAGMSVEKRFADNNDGTITDRLTGLVWLRSADCWGKSGWEKALERSRLVRNGQCGLQDGSVAGDWRIPNVRELESLVDYGVVSPALPKKQTFSNIKAGHVDYYWSSTTSAGDGNSVWGLFVARGALTGLKKTSEHYSWPVRGGHVEPSPAIATPAPKVKATRPTSGLPDPEVLPKDPKTGKIFFQGRVSVEGLPASTLHRRARAWVSGTYRSGPSCLRRDDEKSGQIVVEAFRSSGATGADGPIRYRLTVESEDGAFRWTMSEFVQVQADGVAPLEEWRGTTTEKTRITHMRIDAHVRSDMRNLEYNMKHGSAWDPPPALPLCDSSGTAPGP